MLRLFTGNQSPSLQDTVKVNGAAFDLTGSTVSFRMRDPRSSSLVVDEAATIVDATAGMVRWDPQSADVAAAGHYVCWWAITLPSGFEQDSDEFTLYISSHAPGDPVDLCTIDDVKQAMEPQSSTSNRDMIIQTLITSASRLAARRLERELTPRSTATRTVPVRTQARQPDGTLVVDLAPWDLRDASSMLLHPEDAAPISLTASADYSLEPVGAPQGSYQRLRLSRYLVVVSNFEVRFGYAQLQITGDWGLWDTIEVPDDVRDACVLIVRSWLRQNPGGDQIGLLNRQMEQGLQPAIPATWFIPNAALQRLEPWRRWTA